MRKKRRLRHRHERLFTEENLDRTLRLASFVGQVLKVTPYAKHASPVLDIANAARNAFSRNRDSARVANLAQQNLRLEIQSLTSQLSDLDANSAEYRQISSQLDALLNSLTPSMSN